MNISQTGEFLLVEGFMLLKKDVRVIVQESQGKYDVYVAHRDQIDEAIAGFKYTGLTERQMREHLKVLSRYA